jgi:hypothetical protein
MAIRFAFQGAVRFGEHLELEAAILEELSHDRAAIAGEIAVEIEEVVRARPRVWIEFGRGSIEWFGWVEWVAAAWPTLEALSTVGGAIALVEIVKNGVETVMRRRFNRNSLQQPQLTGTVVAPGCRTTRVAIGKGASGCLESALRTERLDCKRTRLPYSNVVRTRLPDVSRCRPPYL